MVTQNRIPLPSASNQTMDLVNKNLIEYRNQPEGHHLRGTLSSIELSERNPNGRRNTRLSKQQLLFNREPGYRWSVDLRSPYLGYYLQEVPNQISNVIATHGIQLEDREMACLNWTIEHGGAYQMYLPEDSRDAQALLKKKEVKELFQKEEKFAKVEQLYHVIIGKSPRIWKQASSTLSSYETHLRQFWHFLAITGRYTEMLMLLLYPPGGTHCPSVKWQSIRDFTYFKYLPPLTPLTDNASSTGSAIVDKDGIQILAEGTIKNWERLKSFFAAITSIHNQLDKKSLVYSSSCPECERDLLLQGERRCHVPEHIHTPMTRTIGSPMQTEHHKRLVKWLEQESYRRQYFPDHASPFLPCDIHKMHQRLMANGCNIWDMACYTMTLISISTAARFDSFSSLTTTSLDTFSSKWVVTRRHGIEYFLIPVMEKSDKKWSLYQMKFNDHNYRHCPVRHLLIFIHCTQPQGYIFPSKTELQTAFLNVASSEERNCAASYVDRDDYNQFLQDLKSTVPHSEYALFSPHSGRSTAYLFQVLGGATFEQCRRANRHVDYKTAKKYFDCAYQVFEMVKKFPEFQTSAYVLAPFQDNLLEGEGITLERMSAMLHDRICHTSIVDLAAWFVEHCLGIHKGHPHYRDCPVLLDLSYGKRFHVPNEPATQFYQFCDNNLPTNLKDQVIAQFQMYVGQTMMGQERSYHTTNNPIHSVDGPDAGAGQGQGQRAGLGQRAGSRNVISTPARSTSVGAGVTPSPSTAVGITPSPAAGTSNANYPCTPQRLGNADATIIPMQLSLCPFIKPNPNSQGTYIMDFRAVRKAISDHKNALEKVKTLKMLCDDIMKIGDNSLGSPLKNRWSKGLQKISNRYENRPYFSKTINPFFNCFYYCFGQDVAH
jgi:hypothetical protein